MIKKDPFTQVESNLFERSELAESKLNPMDYSFVECQTIGLQVSQPILVKNGVTGEEHPMLAVIVQVAIPVDPEKLTGGLITPDGLGSKFRKACPIAPNLRIGIHNDFIVEHLKNKNTEFPKAEAEVSDLLKGFEL